MNKTKLFCALFLFVFSSISISAQNYLSTEQAIPVLKQYLSDIETDIRVNPLPLAVTMSGEVGPGILRKVKYDFSTHVLNKLENDSETVEKSIQSAKDHFDNITTGLDAVELYAIESEIKVLLSN